MKCINSISESYVFFNQSKIIDIKYLSAVSSCQCIYDENIMYSNNIFIIKLLLTFFAFYH